MWAGTESIPRVSSGSEQLRVQSCLVADRRARTVRIDVVGQHTIRNQGCTGTSRSCRQLRVRDQDRLSRRCSEPPIVLPAQGPCLPLRFQPVPVRVKPRSLLGEARAKHRHWPESCWLRVTPNSRVRGLATGLALTAGALDGAGCFGFATQPAASSRAAPAPPHHSIARLRRAALKVGNSDIEQPAEFRSIFALQTDAVSGPGEPSGASVTLPSARSTTCCSWEAPHCWSAQVVGRRAPRTRSPFAEH